MANINFFLLSFSVNQLALSVPSNERLYDVITSNDSVKYCDNLKKKNRKPKSNKSSNGLEQIKIVNWCANYKLLSFDGHCSLQLSIKNQNRSWLYSWQNQSLSSRLFFFHFLHFAGANETNLRTTRSKSRSMRFKENNGKSQPEHEWTKCSCADKEVDDGGSPC
jgi:hypothetical protein